MKEILLIKTRLRRVPGARSLNLPEPRIGESGRESPGVGSFRLIRSGRRNGHSAQRTAAGDRGIAEPPAQCVDRSLRRRASWRGRIRQIAQIGGRTGDQRVGADADQAKFECRSPLLPATRAPGRTAGPAAPSGWTTAPRGFAARKREVFSFSTTPPAASSCSFRRRASFSHSRQRWRSSSAMADRSRSNVVSALTDFVSRVGIDEAGVLPSGATDQGGAVVAEFSQRLTFRQRLQLPQPGDAERLQLACQGGADAGQQADGFGRQQRRRLPRRRSP